MSRISSNFRNPQDAVIRHSEADEWYSAVNEWIINDVEEDETLTESCVCGKEKLHYLFTIRNILKLIKSAHLQMVWIVGNMQ